MIRDLKEAYRLKGLHTAWICWCSQIDCEHYQIVWVSDEKEDPVLEMEAEKNLYAVGWGKIFEDWFCFECLEKNIPKRKKVKLVSLEESKVQQHDFTPTATKNQGDS